MDSKKPKDKDQEKPAKKELKDEDLDKVSGGYSPGSGTKPKKPDPNHNAR